MSKKNEKKTTNVGIEYCLIFLSLLTKIKQFLRSPQNKNKTFEKRL